MGRFLVFAVIGFGAAFWLDRQGQLPFMSGLGSYSNPGYAPYLPRKSGFIPLETPRSTLPDGSASSRTAARVAYFSRDRRSDLGEIELFLS